MLRNASLNIAAQAIGMAIAFLSTPLIIRCLGPSQFGLLSILWALVGYFSVFDLGTGLGVLKFLPGSLARADKVEAVTVIRISVLTSLAIGIAAMIVAGLLAIVGLQYVAAIPGAMQHEARNMFLVLSLGLPALLLQVSLKGVLMSLDRYDIVNAVQVAVGVLQWGGSAVAVIMGEGLLSVVLITVLVRYAALLCFGAYMLKLLPEVLVIKGEGYRRVFRQFLGFGGWASVPQLVAPLFTLIERLIIGWALSLSMVPVFSVPNDAVIRLLIVPVGVASAILPILSGAWALSETRVRTVTIYHQALKLVLLVMVPLGVVLATFSEEVLSLWMGAEFAQQAHVVLAIVSFGLIGNAVSQIPIALLLSIGRPDSLGKFLLVQVPLYIGLLFVATVWGVVGLAIAWTIRVLVEMAVLLILADRNLRTEMGTRIPHMKREGLSLATAGMVIFGAGKLLSLPLWVEGPLLAGGLVLFLYAGWHSVLNGSERQSILSLLLLQKRPASSKDKF